MLLRYGYTDGHLTSVYNSSGKPMRFANDATGRMLSWTDRNNSQYRYTYDTLDRVVDEGGTDGALRFHFTYGDPDPATRLRTHTETNALGHTTAYLVDDHARITAITDPLGHTTHYERDPYDRLLAETDPLGRTTRYQYDGAGDLASITRPDGERATVTYAAGLSLPETVTEPGGATWRQTYDEAGRHTSLTDPAGATTFFAYDAAGHLAAVTDALGHTTRVRCTPAGLPAEVTDPTGAVTRYDRDAFGRTVAITDPLGAVTRLSWTVEGRPASRTTPDGATESWTYDGEGNCLTRTDPVGRTTAWEYTHFETLAARTGPDGARTTFTHDAHMQLVGVTDPLGRQWSYRYDPAGRLIGESDFQGRALAYEFDAAGRITGTVDPLGRRTGYRHDLLDRLTAKDADGSLTTFDYDAAGNLARAVGPDAEVTRTHDALGRLLTETVNGRTLTHRRDPLGRTTHRTTPAGHTSAWTYDAAGRPAALSTAGGGVGFAHDAAGREVERTYADHLTVAEVRDSRHRLTGRRVSTPAGVLQQRGWTYRADGHLTATEDLLTGSRTFDLDRAGRVTAVTAADWSERYAYDAVGNVTDAHWPATGATAAAVGARSYEGTQLVGAGRVRYEHDAAGRTTLRQVTRLSRKPDSWQYTWDAEDRLTHLTTPDGTRWRYRYDPFGRRIAKERLGADGATATERTDFTWDGAALCEQTARAPYLPGPHTLSWDHHGLHPLAQTETVTAQGQVDRRFFAIVTDLVGTPTELVDPATDTVAWRATSTLWGHTTWPADSTTYTPLRFPGQYFDPESRLHYNVHRYYDPETARYVSPDPLGLAPGPTRTATSTTRSPGRTRSASPRTRGRHCRRRCGSRPTCPARRSPRGWHGRARRSTW
ncbi:RHS repeat protein [Kitasatospora paranensis]